MEPHPASCGMATHMEHETNTLPWRGEQSVLIDTKSLAHVQQKRL